MTSILTLLQVNHSEGVEFGNVRAATRMTCYGIQATVNVKDSTSLIPTTQRHRSQQPFCLPSYFMFYHEKNNSRERPPIITRICMKLVFFPLASAFVQLDSGISFRDLT